MEENKVVEEKENNTTPNQTQNDEKNKTALIAFILACVGVAVCSGWIIGGIAGIILGVLAIKKANASADVTQNPYKVFNKIAKIVGIVLVILSAILIVIWLIWTIVVALGVAVATVA